MFGKNTSDAINNALSQAFGMDVEKQNDHRAKMAKRREQGLVGSRGQSMATRSFREYERSVNSRFDAAVREDMSSSNEDREIIIERIQTKNADQLRVERALKAKAERDAAKRARKAARRAPRRDNGTPDMSFH